MSTSLPSIAALASHIHTLSGPLAVISHARPDGDAIGSALGLTDLLRSLGYDAVGLTPDPVPPYLQFLVGGYPSWVAPDPALVAGRTIITTDIATRGLITPFISDATPIALAIDHHASHRHFAAATYVDSATPAASAIIAQLAGHMGVRLSPLAATALYTGIATDTGCLQWGASGAAYAATLRTVAHLMEAGVDNLAINDRLFGTVSHSFLRLQAFALSRAQYLCDGALVIVALTDDDYASVGATDEDKTILSSFLRSIQGVRISALVSYRGGQCKASVRARLPQYQVNQLCEKFGGGGHPAAAGIGPGITEPLETFLPRFTSALIAHWGRVGGSPLPIST